MFNHSPMKQLKNKTKAPICRRDRERVTRNHFKAIIPKHVERIQKLQLKMQRTSFELNSQIDVLLDLIGIVGGEK